MPHDALNRRLFFALWPEPALRLAVQELAARLPEDGRAVRPENLHITLLFLGATPAERLPALLQAAGKLDAPAFDLRLDQGGWWRKSGIWWLAPGDTPPALKQLAHTLAELARGEGLDVRLEDFRPHLSLRRKARRAPEFPPFAPLQWRARDFVLMESITHAEGAEYREVGRWALAKRE